MSLDSPGPGGDSAVAMANLAGFSAELRLSQDSLRTLAEETGGFAVVNKNDPVSVFGRIVEANSRYYVLGYYPPTHPRDGKFHQIEVRVKRPGMRVLARKGYAAPRGKTPEERARDDKARLAREAKRGGADTTSAELRAVLNSPMQQQGGVPMLVQAAAFKGTAKQASVALAIEMEGAQFRFESRNNGAMFADNVELSYFGLNEQGKPLNGERRELELSLRPDTYERSRRAGLRINERLALAPGRYQLRIGVRESGAGAMGTVFYDLQVPDFAKEPLSMSGMLVTAGSSPIVPTLVPDKLVGAERLPGPATSRRTFAQGDMLAFYAEVYDNIPARQTHTIEIVSRLIGEDGKALFTSRDTHDGAALQGAGSASTVSVTKQISLKDVPPGRYLLQVETTARGSVRDVTPMTRETPVTVVREE